MRIDKEAFITAGFAIAAIFLLWPNKKLRNNPSGKRRKRQKAYWKNRGLRWIGDRPDLVSRGEFNKMAKTQKSAYKREVRQAALSFQQEGKETSYTDPEHGQWNYSQARKLRKHLKGLK